MALLLGARHQPTGSLGAKTEECMEFSVSRKGAAVVSLWFVLGGMLVSLPFWHMAAGTTLLCLLAYALLCLCLLTPRFASCRVRVGSHHLTVRRGLLFMSTWRLPLRFITGCYLLRTPLQRLTGTCCLVLYASGSFSLLAGVHLGDAEALSAHLMQGGRVL